MKKKIAAMIFSLWTVYAFGETDFSKYTIKGPSPMFNITVDCDRDTLSVIEKRLKHGEEEVYLYQYTIYLLIKEHKVDSIELRGMDFDQKVQQCILDAFLKGFNPKGEYPESGLIPVEIEFPALITSETK